MFSIPFYFHLRVFKARLQGTYRYTQSQTFLPCYMKTVSYSVSPHFVLLLVQMHVLTHTQLQYSQLLNFLFHYHSLSFKLWKSRRQVGHEDESGSHHLLDAWMEESNNQHICYERCHLSPIIRKIFVDSISQI